MFENYKPDLNCPKSEEMRNMIIDIDRTIVDIVEESKYDFLLNTRYKMELNSRKEDMPLFKIEF